jgi:hypothetical protein
MASCRYAFVGHNYSFFPEARQWSIGIMEIPPPGNLTVKEIYEKSTCNSVDKQRGKFNLLSTVSGEIGKGCALI